MHGACFDFPLQEWFEFEIPDTSVADYEMEMAVQNNPGTLLANSSKLIWIHPQPRVSFDSKKQKGKLLKRCKFEIHSNQTTVTANFTEVQGRQFNNLFEHLLPQTGKTHTVAEFRQLYESGSSESFDKLLKSQGWLTLRKVGLLYV